MYMYMYMYILTKMSAWQIFCGKHCVCMHVCINNIILCVCSVSKFPVMRLY